MQRRFRLWWSGYPTNECNQDQLGPHFAFQCKTSLLSMMVSCGKVFEEIPTKNYKLFQFEFLNVFHDEVVADLKRWMFEKTNLSVSTCSIQKSSSSSAWECHLLKLSIVHKSIAYHFNKEFMEIMIHDPTSRFYIRILEMIHNRVPYKKLFSQYILDDSFSPIFKVVKYIKGEHYHTIWFLGSAKYLSSSK